MEKRPSIPIILLTDYPAFVAFLFPLVAAAVLVFIRLSEDGPIAPWLLVVAGAGLVIGLAVVIWRIRLIHGIFEYGEQTPAVVNAVSFFRDRGHLGYIYTYRGQKYQGSAAVMKTWRTKAYQSGQEVAVMVDRDNPKRAFIRDLYL
jgi:hypothetical protein